MRKLIILAQVAAIGIALSQVAQAQVDQTDQIDQDQTDYTDICPTQVQPLLITLANDSDDDLEVIAPRAFKSYVRSNPNVTEPINTIVVTRNYAGQNVSVVVPQQYPYEEESPQIEDQQPLSERLCLPDIRALEDQTLYAHKKYFFQIRRTGFPAHLFLKFRVAAQEPYGEYEVARWEYAEEGGRADATCNLDAARLRYTIECSGNNSINNPIMNINIGRIYRPIVPRPLINGAEPDVGPPSTP